MAQRKIRRPHRGSLRVAAWIHEVINPLLEALRAEVAFLDSGNTTWRYLSGRPEYVRSIEDYLAPEARPILRDFLQANTDARKRLGRHDELFQDLVLAAGKAHATLINREDFISTARQRLAEFMATTSGSDFPGGAIPQEDFPKLVAERVVNGIQNVYEHYSDAKFWARYGRLFLDFGRGPEFDHLRQARDAFLKHDRLLQAWLEKKSFQLCEEYDVPAAPFPGWNRSIRTVGSA